MALKTPKQLQNRYLCGVNDTSIIHTLSEPNTNDLHRLLPAARMGMEMMAPSGMF